MKILIFIDWESSALLLHHKYLLVVVFIRVYSVLGVMLNSGMFIAIICSVVVATFLFVFLADLSVSAVIDWLARKVGLLSGAGGIAGVAQTRNDEVVVSLECQGSDAFHLAVMKGLGVNGQSLFLVPSRLGDTSLEDDDEKTAYKKLSKVKIAAKHTFEIGFPRDAFVAMQFQELTALDYSGKSWSIDISAVREL